MTDRRRNLFVLLVVVGPDRRVAGGHLHEADEARARPPGRRAARLPGASRPRSSRRSRRRRWTARWTSCATASTRSASPSPSSSAPARTRSTVSLPGVKNAERAADQVGTTAQLYFYDWEPNILDADCKTNPEQVNGGQQPITGLYNAVKRASKCPPEIDGNNTTTAPLLRVRQEVARAAQRRDPGGDRGRPRRGPADAASAPTAPRSSRCPRASSSSAPTTTATGDQQTRPARPAGGSCKDNPVAVAAPTSRTPSRTSRTAPAAPPIVTMDFTRQGPQGVRRRPRARSPSAAPTTPRSTAACRTRSRLAPLRDPARQRADLDAVHQLPREPGRDRRLARRADLGRLHDPDGAGPRAAAEDRRAAARGSS